MGSESDVITELDTIIAERLERLQQLGVTGADRIIGQDGVQAGSLTGAGVISLEEVPGILKRYLPDSGLREVAYALRKYRRQLTQFRRCKRRCHCIVAGIDGLELALQNVVCDRLSSDISR